MDRIISNRKNLEHVLDNMKEGIIAHDLNRYIFFFNREAEKITGYHRDEVLGKDCHDVFGGPLCGERCSFGDRKANDMEDKEYTINIVTKSGDDRRIEMAVTMMEDKKGHIIGFWRHLRM